MNSTELGQRLTYYRERRGWKQKELAQRLNYSVSVISRLEKGHRRPTNEQLARLIAILELSWAETTELYRLMGQAVKLLHNLPAPYYPEFIGRHDDIQKLCQWLTVDSKINQILIHATGGMGKTTLAHHVAWSYVEQPGEFEAIIWVTAQIEKFDEYEPEPILVRSNPSHNLNEIYHEIATCLHDRTLLEQPLADIQRHIYRALSKQPTLLILDNFETIQADSSIRAFMKDLPISTKLLLTSREKRVELTSFKTLELKPLLENETLALIQSHLHKSESITLTKIQQQQLWHITQGHTIAIVWSMGRLANGDDIELILAELQVVKEQHEVDKALHESKNKLARFCFERSLAHIDGQPAANLLAAMCLFAHNQIAPQALMYVAAVTQKEYDQGLMILKRLAFIYEVNDRMGILPLTKEFTLRYVTTEMERRFVDYFAGLCYEHVGGDYWKITQVKTTKPIEDELKNIDYAIDLADKIEAWQAVQQLYMGILHMLSLSHKTYFRRVLLGERAIKATQKLGPSHEEILAWFYIDALGWALIATQQAEKAKTYIKIGQEIALKHHFTECLACADFMLARWEFYFGDDEAQFWQYVNDCLAQATTPMVKLRAYEVQMKYHRRKGEWVTAKTACLKAIEVAANCLADKVWLQVCLGEFNLKLGHLTEAQDSFIEADRLRKETSGYRHVFFTNMGLAIIARKQGDEIEAQSYAENALAFCEYFDLEHESSAIQTFIHHPNYEFDLAKFDLF